ncbi:hypothetical protein Acav_1830 [Paracidovorax avenae ATCC 19860]|uniref:Uncharacterized protein n=1 Tax=Paracidovorax avenae (strain ATCC 19860 / DSM 7227 / CCUG 15838 / JCM 20985 / LMG 2117 / NCPPB 1011) TaxID=643561 RepID=F0Q773_PARA1|nr:hypothetical protein [Paracidovorax avenae]ADX45748.1 hypothetical protein Acav_1830 [Paracidovorax avenae ATCC 19860]
MKNDVLNDLQIIEQAENSIDTIFQSTDFPSTRYSSSLWHLLTCYEDRLRLSLMQVETPQQLMKFSSFGGRDIYALRNAISRVREQYNDDKNQLCPRKVDAPSYLRSHELLNAGEVYATAQKIFGSFRGKSVSLNCNGTNIKVLHQPDVEARYAAFELLSHGIEGITFIPRLLSWMKGDHPPTVDLIIKKVSYKKLLISYDFHPGYAYGLSLSLASEGGILPPDWIFDWGGIKNTELLINALHIRCIYHFIVIQFWASKVGLKGGGLESLVLKISKADLLRDISSMTQLDNSIILKFIKFLTFGNNTKFPDPALQPIIPIGEFYLLPTLLFMLSNHRRNLLSLQARVDAKNFDDQSKAFESAMTASIKKDFQNKWRYLKTNCIISFGSKKRELDLLIVDEVSSTILIGELRWMIQPGDVREILNRANECRKKVSQCTSALIFFKNNLNYFLEKIFSHEIPAPKNGEWHVVGLVLIEGYSGIESLNSEIPIINRNIFDVGMSEFNDLSVLHEWLKSLDWLPKNGIDFDEADYITTIGEYKIDQPGISLRTTPNEYAARAKKSASTFIKSRFFN